MTKATEAKAEEEAKANSVKVKTLDDVIIAGKAVAKGKAVAVSKSDARVLIGMGKAEAV